MHVNYTCSLYMCGCVCSVLIKTRGITPAMGNKQSIKWLIPRGIFGKGCMHMDTHSGMPRTTPQQQGRSITATTNQPACAVAGRVSSLCNTTCTGLVEQPLYRTLVRECVCVLLQVHWP